MGVVIVYLVILNGIFLCVFLLFIVYVVGEVLFD